MAVGRRSQVRWGGGEERQVESCGRTGEEEEEEEEQD